MDVAGAAVRVAARDLTHRRFCRVELRACRDTPPERLAGVAPPLELAGQSAMRRDERDQAGRRPQRSRARPKIPSASADDHAMADTSGAPKSVPEKNAWKKMAANAM